MHGAKVYMPCNFMAIYILSSSLGEMFPLTSWKPFHQSCHNTFLKGSTIIMEQLIIGLILELGFLFSIYFGSVMLLLFLLRCGPLVSCETACFCFRVVSINCMLNCILVFVSLPFFVSCWSSTWTLVEIQPWKIYIFFVLNFWLALYHF